MIWMKQRDIWNKQLSDIMPVQLLQLIMKVKNRITFNVDTIILFVIVQALGALRLFYYNYGTDLNPLLLIMLLLLITPVSFLMSSFLIGVCDYITSQASKRQSCAGCHINSSIGVKDSLIVFSMILMVLTIWYVSFFPGSFSNDSINQLIQAKKAAYNDWHPFVHTLLFFTFPLFVSGGKTWAIMLFQIIEESLVIAYAARTLGIVASKTIVYAFVAFLALNPLTGAISTYPWKDVAFAMATTLLTCQTMRTYATKGDWIHTLRGVFSFGATFALCCLLRHNGILFALPMGLIVFVFAGKWGVMACMVGLLFVGCIKVPVALAIGVEQPGNRQVEVLGFPMEVLGGVMHSDPDSLDDETREFLLEVSPKESWDQIYVWGDFNSIKWESRTDLSRIETAGAQRVIEMALRAAVKSPQAALHAATALLAVAHSVRMPIVWTIYPGIAPNNEGVYYERIDWLAQKLETALFFSQSGILSVLFWHTGTIELLLVAAALSCRHKSKVVAMFALPLLIHNLGTSLLLTGPDFRFFWLTYPVGLLDIAFMLCEAGRIKEQS